MINDQREQEWNISRKELLELVKVGILGEEDIDEITAAKFNPVSLDIQKPIHFFQVKQNQFARPW